MTKFNDLDIKTQNDFTLNNLIPVRHGYYSPEQYKNLVIPNWNYIINDFIKNFTREKIINNLQGNENYPKGDLQYKDGGASFYFCKLLDVFDVKNKKIAIIGSEKPWIEAIVYNYGCRDITTVEYNKPFIEHENFKVISYDEFKISNNKYDMILSYSSIEHSGLGRYGDNINPNGDIDTMTTIYEHLYDDGILSLGMPIGRDTLIWNANRIYGRKRLPMLLSNFKVIQWYGGDSSCIDIIPMCNGSFAYQPILVCKKK